MAYMEQEKKKRLVELVKRNCRDFFARYQIKYSVSVRNHSTIVFTIRQGTFDFLKYSSNEHDNKSGYMTVSQYHIDRHFAESDTLRKFFHKLANALNSENYNNSDIMTDYFDVGYYIDIKIGDWDKPYKLLPEVSLKLAA